MKYPNVVRLAVPLLCAALLVACGEDEAPAAPVAEKAVEPAKPERQAEAAPAPPPVQEMPYVVMPEDTGSKPPENIMSAYDVGQAALEAWCVEKKFSCETFGRKDMVQEGDHWVTQYFGAPGGEGMYVSVRVYPDGRSEVVR